MVNISYIEADEAGFDLVRPLWEQLNEHHRLRSTHFTRHYETFTFEQRKEDLLTKARGGLLRIGLAKDADRSRYVGYCVASLITERGRPVGEVESIYVEGSYRSNGIGDTLMKKALEWMDAHGASVKKVSVGAGNEDVWPFYARYGFYPRLTMLEQLKK